MNLQVSCQTSRGTLTLRNPIMPAAGSYGNILEYKDLVDLRLLGAVIPNSFMSAEGKPLPAVKYHQTEFGFISAFGPNNMSLKRFIETVLPQFPPDCPPIIVNLKAVSMEDMLELAALAAGEERIDGIEINYNCPYGQSSEPAYWLDPAKLERMTAGVKRVAADKLVIAKVPTGPFLMDGIPEAAEAGGADLFVSFNGLKGAAVDIQSRTYRCGLGGGGGYSGVGVKPFGLSRCREALSKLKIPVIGAGGIACAEDVMEYILAGAYAVQVGSANLTRPDLMHQIIADLHTLMERLGISCLDDVRGTAKVVRRHLFDSDSEK